jgi:hypothetical protein
MHSSREKKKMGSVFIRGKPIQQVGQDIAKRCGPSGAREKSRPRAGLEALWVGEVAWQRTLIQIFLDI